MFKRPGPSYKCKRSSRRINVKKSKSYKTIINNFYIGNQFLNTNINNTYTNQCRDSFQYESGSNKENRFCQSPAQSKLSADALAHRNSFQLFASDNGKIKIFELIQDTKNEIMFGSTSNETHQKVTSKTEKFLSHDSMSLSSNDELTCKTLSEQFNKFHLDENLSTKIIALDRNVNLFSGDTCINNQIRCVPKNSTGKVNALNNLFLNSPHVLCAVGKLIQMDLKGKQKKWKKNKDLKGLCSKFCSKKNSPKQLLPSSGNNLLSSSGTSTPFCDKLSDEINWEISPIKNFSTLGNAYQKQDREKLGNSLEELMSIYNNGNSPDNAVKQISELGLVHEEDHCQLIKEFVEKQGSSCEERDSLSHDSMIKSSPSRNGQSNSNLPLLCIEEYLPDGKRKSNYSDDIFDSFNSVQDKDEYVNKEQQLPKLPPNIFFSNVSISCPQEEDGIKVSVEEIDAQNPSNDCNKHEKTSISSVSDFHSVKSYSKYDYSVDSNNSFNFSFTQICPDKTHEENTDQVIVTQRSKSNLEPYIRIIPGKKWRRSLLVTAKRTMVNGNDNKKDASKTSRSMRFSFDPQNNFYSFTVKQPFRHTDVFQLKKLEEIKEQSPLHEQETKNCTIDKSPDDAFANLDTVKGREETDDEDNRESSTYEEKPGELDFTIAIHQEVANILQKDDLNKTYLSVSPDSDGHKKFAKENVLNLCGLRTPIKFCDAYSKKIFTNCKKIGEGIFGEVFCYIPPRSKQKIALKIIPIEGERLVNFSPQKTYSEVFSEMCIAFSLSSLKTGSDVNNYTDGFCSLLRMTCLKGKYPDDLIEEWNEYHKTRGSENDSPALFDSEQLYIALEMLHAGEPLESFQFSSARQSYSILLQVIHSLAVAENSFEFEHRDLHWGNVLISKTYKKKIKYVIDGVKYYVSSYGKKSTIIDYTLSRIRSGNFNIYNDIGADYELFEAYGDYQFDIYRSMRDDVGNNWKLYVPKSNVRWVHYLATKCCEEVYYKTNHNIHKSYLVKMKCLRDKIISYSSTIDIVKDLKNNKII